MCYSSVPRLEKEKRVPSRKLFIDWVTFKGALPTLIFWKRNTCSIASLLFLYLFFTYINWEKGRNSKKTIEKVISHEIDSRGSSKCLLTDSKANRSQKISQKVFEWFHYDCTAVVAVLSPQVSKMILQIVNTPDLFLNINIRPDHQYIASYIDVNLSIDVASYSFILCYYHFEMLIMYENSYILNRYTSIYPISGLSKSSRILNMLRHLFRPKIRDLS